MDIAAEAATCRFDDIVVDRRARAVWRVAPGGPPDPLQIRARAYDILCVLIDARGGLVSKQDLMDAAWPNITVEENNLTVQISGLRRVLDEGRAQGSAIQTVPGRGYRFVPHIVSSNGPDELSLVGNQPAVTATATTPDPVDTLRSSATGPRLPWMLIACVAVLCLAAVAVPVWLVWHAAAPLAARAERPHLSLVVLPFQNLGSEANDDYLVDGVTDDLTTGLSHIPEAFVIAHASARTYKGKAVDAKQIGHEMGVHYVVAGSVRRVGTALRVNVELISTETGAQVWSDMFDEAITDLAAGQNAILARMRGTLRISLVEIEIARRRQTPPTTPDAFDLILRARALRNLPHTRQRFDQALSLYEQALRMDAASVLALTGAAAMLLEIRSYSDSWRGSWPGSADAKRVERLLAQAQDVAPSSEEVLGVYAYWLFTLGDCNQSMPAARRMIETYPNPTFGYGLLSECLIVTGHSDEAVPLIEKVMRLNPRDPNLARRFNVLGSAYLFINDNENAIKWLRRAVAEVPQARDNSSGGTKRKLAAAYARTGKDLEARRALAAADKDWPFDTVRGHWPDDLNPIFAAQVREYQESLRSLGERDHAEEDADYGVASDSNLRVNPDGYTPMTAPGVVTIRTTELQRFITERNPVIIDAATYFWGRSIHGAVALKYAGVGGTFSDNVQDRLRQKLTVLTGGDQNRPIVAVGWNAERFDGRNLALRLVALGYIQVYWYRGGREAWEVAGNPETDLVETAW